MYRSAAWGTVRGMGSRSRLAKSSGKAIATAFAVGVSAGIIGNVVKNTTGSTWKGYAAAGGLQSAVLIGLGLYYADRDAHYAGGVTTLGIGTALVTTLGVTAMAQGTESPAQTTLRTAAAGAMVPSLPADPTEPPVKMLEVQNLREVPTRTKRRS